MKIIVTGANGMLGSSLCRLYYDQHEVHALHRDKKCFTDCLADYSLDLINTKKVEELFNLIKPDLVIHCAGLTDVDTSTIRTGSIADHNFGAPRCNNLALDVSKLSHTGLTAPDYKESLIRFSQDTPR